MTNGSSVVDLIRGEGPEQREAFMASVFQERSASLLFVTPQRSAASSARWPRARSTDKAIAAALRGKQDEFVASVVEFGRQYGEVARDDHQIFIDAFRNHRVMNL